MSAIELNHKKIPFKSDETQTPLCGPIIVLHGLFGSSKNWLSVGEFLSAYSDVYLLDQRNHGDSPHTSEQSLVSMVEDLELWISQRNLSSPVIFGHSMGGLTAMGFALKNPNIPESILVQDIAPRDYPFRYERELACLRTDVSEFKSRNEIDAALAKIHPDPFIRGFLEMNLERSESGGYRWKLNVEGIAGSPRLLEDFFSRYAEFPFAGETSFIIGGASDYFSEGDRDVARSFFPNAKFYSIPDGDHYIHFTKAEEFKRVLTSIFRKDADSEFLTR
ncbi:alpha/beta fold hydrolase [Leptospira gomenensis]|uniref:Alpha/beta fold hydrolase n=1 Tax=Leptospira gomenensis TaxID=2484974 RepID=A0A5F1YUP6_9LEPT|nr:alpha/beta fold hydrolase [Leptospira gomenensis]TGK35162.1 alpha/beta fold hydrolase [Leptospira gomenensis]TGK35868.1 alpha/beta fold hydrolase [Leptospira gomenensis]TGK41024.1 alpha/beta fold hydrolase [Leptospira gomenensis]TGK61253.1 alpha/beta fold hydrolase [Leptospira gomenensis]